MLLIRNFNFVRIFLVALLVTVAAGCANAPPSSPPPDVSLLVTAGFKIVAASTAVQQQHLTTMNPGISEMQQTGKHYYVYPDVPNNRLYIGTPKEYQAYLALRTRNGLPNPPPSNVTTADIRNYLKQDAAMIQADASPDASIPPGAIWPDFSALDWVP
jgi:hypothetical protein